MRKTTFLASLLSLVAFAVANAAPAARIEVRGAWIRATPPGAATAAGYRTIVNHGPTSDRLRGGHTSKAAGLEVHQMSTAGGVMRLRALPGGIAVGAGATLTLGPNGDHLMLVGLKGPLKAGDHVKATLEFSRAGPVTVDFPGRTDAPGARM